MTDIHQTIQSLLLEPGTLRGWELARVKCAAGCSVVGEDQARVIRGLNMKNNQDNQDNQDGRN